MKKKILILGGNGYIGKTLHNYLEEKEYPVLSIDNGMREALVEEIGGSSLTPNRKYPKHKFGDITFYSDLEKYIKEFKPDTIVHLAEQPSAPYSMRGREECNATMQNNLIGTMNLIWAVKTINPKIHIIKLGTAGEYPDWLYPEMEIPEGSRVKVQYKGKDWEIPTPRYAGSWYHFSKFHDSFNLDYANRIWGLKITDINQGPVYGVLNENCRFDYDEHFGTVVNRFAVQAVIGHPLTVYGEGEQTRGYIHIKNSMESIELMIENEPKNNEFRVIHQVTETKTINEIAEMFAKETGVKIKNIPNPRAENGKNKFEFEAKALQDLGLKTIPMEQEIKNIIKVVEKYKSNINKDVILPKTNWK